MNAIVDFPVKPEARPYLDAFDRGVALNGASEPGPLARLRRRGLTRFAETGFPSRKSESWRYLDLQPLAQQPFVREALGDLRRRDRRRAQLGHRGKQRLLVRGVGAYRLDQVRHEVGAALELHVDIGVALPHQVAIGDHAVVEPHRGRSDTQPDHRRPDLRRHVVISPTGEFKEFGDGARFNSGSVPELFR